MEQYNKIVLEAPKGMHYTVSQGENRELIVRLVSNEQETCQSNTICSQSEAVQKSTDKAKYFTKISAKEREKVKKWLATQENAPEWAVEFLETVRSAIKVVGYDYWIANMEPSVKNHRKIYYAKGEKVGESFSPLNWNKMAKEYAPERDSRLSNLYELFIWYALRIADDLWTLEYVVQDSSSAGNYKDAPNSTRPHMEETGARACGGYRDGQGNTSKLVTVEDDYVRVGGNIFCFGSCKPVASVGRVFEPYEVICYCCGVVVLTK